MFPFLIIIFSYFIFFDNLTVSKLYKPEADWSRYRKKLLS